MVICAILVRFLSYLLVISVRIWMNISKSDDRDNPRTGLGQSLVHYFWYPIARVLGKRMYKVETTMKHGAMFMTFRPFLVSDDILMSGFWEKYLMPLLEIKPGDVFVDAGAHIGFHTVVAAIRTGEHGCVIAVEPDKRNYKILVKNITANKLQNVISVNAALGDYSGKAELYYGREPMASSLYKGMLELKRKGIEKVEQVQVVTLDELLRSLGVSRVDSIKVDVEGAELSLLRGAINTLTANDVKLVLEIVPQLENEIRKLLMSCGYKVSHLQGLVFFAEKKRHK